MDAECGECDMIVDDLPKPQTLEGTVEYQVQSRASVVQINRYSWREPREAVFKADAPIIDILLSRRFAELDASFLESSRPEPRPVGDILFMPPNYTLHSRWDRGEDRKSTRLTPVTNAHIVCRLLLEKKQNP